MPTAYELYSEFGKIYWGIKESFMKRSMLLVFAEKMGHEYEGLLDGAVEDEDADGKLEEADPTALAMANLVIAERSRKEEEKEDEKEKVFQKVGEGGA